MMRYVYLDAAAKGRLQGFVVGLGYGTPADGVKEGLQAFGVVERVWVRQRGFLMHGSTRFQLPYDLKFLAKSVIFHGRELDQVVGGIGNTAKSWCRRNDFGNDKRPFTNNGQLADFWS